jgi:hypothetical protein
MKSARRASRVTIFPVWFDETTALDPLPARMTEEHEAGDEETWPTGL